MSRIAIRFEGMAIQAVITAWMLTRTESVSPEQQLFAGLVFILLAGIFHIAAKERAAQ